MFLSILISLNICGALAQYIRIEEPTDRKTKLYQAPRVGSKNSLIITAAPVRDKFSDLDYHRIECTYGKTCAQSISVSLDSNNSDRKDDVLAVIEDRFYGVRPGQVDDNDDSRRHSYYGSGSDSSRTNLQTDSRHQKIRQNNDGNQASNNWAFPTSSSVKRDRLGVVHDAGGNVDDESGRRRWWEAELPWAAPGSDSPRDNELFKQRFKTGLNKNPQDAGDRRGWNKWDQEISGSSWSNRLEYDRIPGSYGSGLSSLDSQPNSYDNHPGKYDSRPDRYDSYDSRPDSYDSRPDRYGSYDNRPDRYDSRPDRYDSYDSRPDRYDSYNSQPDSYDNRPDSFDSRPGSYDSRPSGFDKQPDSHDRVPSTYPDGYSQNQLAGGQTAEKQPSDSIKYGATQVLIAQLGVTQAPDKKDKDKTRVQASSPASVSVASSLGVVKGPNYPRKPSLPPATLKYKTTTARPTGFTDRKDSVTKRPVVNYTKRKDDIKYSGSRTKTTQASKTDSYYSRKERYDPFAFQATTASPQEKRRPAEVDQVAPVAVPAHNTDSRYSIQVPTFTVQDRNRQSPIVIDFKDAMNRQDSLASGTSLRETDDYSSHDYNSIYKSGSRRKPSKDRPVRKKGSGPGRYGTSGSTGQEYIILDADLDGDRYPSYAGDVRDERNSQNSGRSGLVPGVGSADSVAGYQGGINPVFVSLDQSENQEIQSLIPTPPPRHYFPSSNNKYWYEEQTERTTLRPSIYTTTPSSDQKEFWSSQTTRPQNQPPRIWPGYDKILEDLLRSPSFKVKDTNKYVGEPHIVSTKPIVVGPSITEANPYKDNSVYNIANSYSDRYGWNQPEPGYQFDRPEYDNKFRTGLEHLDNSIEDDIYSQSSQNPSGIGADYAGYNYGSSQKLDSDYNYGSYQQSNNDLGYQESSYEVRNYTSLDLAKPVWDDNLLDLDLELDGYKRGTVQQVDFDDVMKEKKQKETYGEWDNSLDILPEDLSRLNFPEDTKWILLSKSRSLDDGIDIDSSGNRSAMVSVGAGVDSTKFVHVQQ